MSYSTFWLFVPGTSACLSSVSPGQRRSMTPERAQWRAAANALGGPVPGPHPALTAFLIVIVHRTRRGPA
jgi:hypothetical protein